MIQLIVGLLGIYLGLAISFEQMLKYFFRYSDHDLSQEDQGTITKFINWLNRSKIITGIIGFVIGIIVFIAPTPTLQVVSSPTPHVQEVTQRFFGDLFPAVAIIISSLILNSKIIAFFNFTNTSYINRFMNFITTYKFWIGVGTIFISFIHLILGSSILL